MSEEYSCFHGLTSDTFGVTASYTVVSEVHSYKGREEMGQEGRIKIDKKRKDGRNATLKREKKIKDSKSLLNISSTKNTNTTRVFFR